HFHIAGLKLFHAGREDDAAAINKHDVGENILDLVDLVRGDHDGARAIEVVVKQGVVKLLAEEDVETKRGLVEHKQPGIDGHHQGQVELGDHALGQFPDLTVRADRGPGQESFRLRAIEARVDAGDVLKGLRNPHPAWQHGNVGDE